MGRALIIFAKRPEPGRVKTRLTTLLTPEEAAELYGCMLEDTLAKARRVADTVTLHLFYEPEPGAEQYFQQTAQGMEIAPQEGKDLGERMEHAFRYVLSRRFRPVAIIGTDSPHLPIHYLHDAFQRLQEDATDVIFGPSEDGGYYLLAMKRLHAELFTGIAWSTEKVLRKSMEKAEREGLSVALIPQWHDIDTAEDLLRPELLDVENGAPLTREFVTHLREAFGFS